MDDKTRARTRDLVGRLLRMGRPITNEAADLIEAQAKRIEELEGALRWYVSDDVKESWWIVDEIGDRIQQFAEIGERARRALAGKEDT